MTAETHPQRAQIIAMLMDTSRRISTRQIAETIVPPLSHATIARFRARLLGHATQNMRGSNDINRSVIDLAAVSNGTGVAEPAREEFKERIRNELQQTVAARKSRRERWISEAEKRPIVSTETGEIVGNMMDHKALAAHDRNEGSDIEFTARLSGLLQDSSTGAATIRAVVLMPAPGDPAAAQPAEPGRLAVEIDLKR